MIRRYARPYAQALLARAGTDEAAAQVREELRSFARVMLQTPALSQMAANPVVPRDVKERILQQIGDRLGLGELTRRFLGLLLAHYRLMHLPVVLETLDEILNRRLGVALAEVATAERLADEQVGGLEATLRKVLEQEVDLKLTEDPRLLGGFVARIGSTLYDASVRGQLQRLAAKLAQGS